MELEDHLSKKNVHVKLTRFRIVKNLAIISLTFLLVFTAYDGLSMLQSTMNEEQGIGTYSQAVVYLTFGTSSLLLPKYAIKKLGCKTALLLGTILYWPYIASNFYPQWITMMPSAILIGIGASILWSSQCTYFNEAASLYCKLVNEKDEETKHPDSVSGRKDTEIPPMNKEDIVKKQLVQDTKSKENVSVSSCGGIYLKSFITHDSNSTNLDMLPNKELKFIETLSDNSRTKFDSKEEGVLEIKEANKYTCVDGRSSISVISKSAVGFIDYNFVVHSEGLKIKSESGNMTNHHHQQFSKCTDLSRDNIEIRTELQPQFITPNKNRIRTDNLSSHIELITARFFGCHGLVYYTANIWSNMISYYALSTSNVQSEINNSSCSCGSGFCNTEYDCFSDDPVKIHSDTRYLLTGIAVVLNIMGSLLILFFLDPLHKDKETVTFSLNNLMATFNHFKKTEQLCLVPLSLGIGMTQAFYTADFTKSYIQCAWSTSHVGLVTIFYGLACCVSSTVSGCLVKYTGRIPLFLMCQAINIGTNIFLLHWTPDSNNPFLFYLAAGLWGVIIGLFWSQTQAFYGILFKKDEEAAFASYYLCSAMGWTLSFTYSNYICASLKIYILMTMSSIGILGYSAAEICFRKYKNETKK